MMKTAQTLLLWGGAIQQGKYAYYYIDDVSVIDCDTLGIAGGNNAKELEISVFPNPAKNLLSVTHTLKTPVSIEIYNYQGKKITENKINKPVNVLSVKDMPVGMYLYRISESGLIVKTGKLILSR